MNDTDQWFEHFIEINDKWGHFGNLYWLNSDTMPHRSPWHLRLVTTWGCFIPHLPEPGIWYDGETPIPESWE